ncbi:MAG TPA: ferredoxin [Elusimicrobia bacterium]|nr:ferredoxin [Elusimicrobiota bacterium]
MSCTIKFLPDEKEIIVDDKTDLLTAAIKAGVSIYSSCGGAGTCGKCKVVVNTGEVETSVSPFVSAEEKAKGYVLACKSFCKTDLEVFVPESSRVGKAEILMRGEKIFIPAGLPAVKKGKSAFFKTGVAVDIGTTTVVVYLVDLDTGELCARAMYNPQVSFGEDVITRMIFAESEDGNRQLHQSLVDGINELMENCAKEKNVFLNNINVLVAAGNTTMTHTLFGLNPSYIRKIPYLPKMDFLPVSSAKKSGIRINEDGVIKALPSVSAYVGGDIVAGVVACALHKSEDLAIFIDLGTNGEIVFGNKEFLVCCSTSAGPCFEGGGIKWGMRAQSGAIESLTISGDNISFNTISNQKPVGICGAGIISIITELLLNGIIDRSGAFVKNSSKNLKSGEEELEFFITDKISITASDIKNVINSKGAVFSGCDVLVKKMGFEFKQLSQVIIAGGLGNALDIKKSIILGLLPDLPIEKFRFIGNASVTGAKMCLLSQEKFNEAKFIAETMTYIDLSTDNEFMNNYTASLFLPHVNLRLFPTVKNIMEK